MDPLWVTAVVTVVLAVVTGYYARETHRIRVNTLRPMFSLTTDLHTMGNRTNGLVLVNSGPVARDVSIDIDPPLEREQAKLYFPAIHASDSVRLTRFLEERLERRERILVKLSYLDAAGKNYVAVLSLDSRKLVGEDRQLGIPESRNIA